MTTAAFVQLARNPLERLFDRLADPVRSDRVMALMLAGYAAVWSAYGVVAKGSQDLHFDMGEMFAWSHWVTFGTPKHPPLGAWLVRAWFSIFPLQPWAYYLFAIVLATLALWIAWRLSAHYLSPEKRIVGIVLLMLIPFYNFHALKFNANTVLIPCWAAATFCFLRSYETRRPGWAVAAGIAAAAAMLGKYWSIFLLAGLASAALSDPRRGAYFRSSAPWLTIAVTAILLAPHAAWIVAHDFAPFHYALESHPGTLSTAAQSAAMFVAGILAYLAVPIAVCAIAAKPGPAAIADTVWPAEPSRRIVVIAFAAPLLLAVLAALVLQVQIVSLWAISAVTLFPIIMLSSPLVTFSRIAAVRLLGAAIALPLFMLAISPVIAAVIHREGVPNFASHYHLIAQAVQQAWRERTNAPLRIIGSYTNVVNGIIFYFPSQPATFDIVAPAQTPWVDDDRIRREGIAIVCPKPIDTCRHALDTYAVRYSVTRIKDVTLARRYLGVPDKPVHYQIVIIPPETP